MYPNNWKPWTNVFCHKMLNISSQVLSVRHFQSGSSHGTHGRSCLFSICTVQEISNMDGRNHKSVRKKLVWPQNVSMENLICPPCEAPVLAADQNIGFHHMPNTDIGGRRKLSLDNCYYFVIFKRMRAHLKQLQLVFFFLPI